MFVLRKISESGVQMNIAMGNGYTLISKSANKNEFKKTANRYNWENCIYAFISCNNGETILPLSSNQKSFVMTGKGNTFSNVSLQ